MRWSFAPLVALLLLIGSRANAQPADPEIWFNPHGPGVDLMNMWTTGAPWPEASKRVNVLVLVHWWVLQQTDATLIQIRDYANQYHMKIDLSTEPIAKIAPVTCGNEEGYVTIGQMTATIAKLVNLGIRPEWVDMDGPITAGSYDTSVNGCQYDIPTLVSKVAATMQYVVAAWPAIKIMDIEGPILLEAHATWRRDVTAFHMGLQQQLGGSPVQAMQADMQWQNPAWKQAMLAMQMYVHQQGMQFSIIYDGNSTMTTDADWINSVVANWESVEGGLHLIPDQILITSWDLYPSHNMPETSPSALTWLLNQYLRPRSELQVQFVGQGAHGKLSTIDGKPIANATVNGFQPGASLSQPLPVVTLRGVVPPGTVNALLGVRINAECSCSGVNDVLFGTVSYQETQNGSASGSFNFDNASRTMNGAAISAALVGGATVTRINAIPGQGLELNGPAWFPVTAGANYTLSVPAATVGGRGWYGNVIVIFADGSGNQSRGTLVPSPGKALISTVTTNPDGTFDLFPMPRNVDGPGTVTVEFDGGGATYRSTVWTPAP